jgi:L-cysteine desulfidase
VLCDTVTNTIATVSGMVCDGAKSSCAAKISTALQTALLGIKMGLHHCSFQPGEGLVDDNVETTIRNIGRMGREGMKSTDLEILNIMLGK